MYFKIFIYLFAVIVTVYCDDIEPGNFSEEAFTNIPEEIPSNIPEEDPFIMGRIVGGYRGNIADLNYQVSVQIKSNNKFKHFCGGSIVSSTRVVSAAHCFYDGRFMEFAVRVGSNYSTSGGQFIGVRTIDIHPLFNPYTVDYDVAVLKLSTPISFNVNAQPINLAPAGDTITPYSYATISGWGVTKSGGALSTALLQTTVPIVTTIKCEQVYGTLTQNMFCAGLWSEGGKDSCQGKL